MTVWLQHYVTCMSTAVPAIFAACPDAAAKATHGHGDVSPRTGSTRERSARHVYPLLGVVSGRCMGVVFCWRSEWSFEILSTSYNTYWRFATNHILYLQFFESEHLPIFCSQPTKETSKAKSLFKKEKQERARTLHQSLKRSNYPTDTPNLSQPAYHRSKLSIYDIKL